VEELRAMFRLEGELGEHPPGSEAQRLHGLRGMCALVGADVGLWVTLTGLRAGDIVITDAVDVGFAGESERRTFLSYVGGEQRRSEDPALSRVPARMDSPVGTFARAQLIDDRGWYRSDHVQEFRRAGRVDGFLYALRVGGDGDTGYGIGMHRAWGRRAYTERERRLLDVFHRESQRLRATLPTDGPATGLPPRLAQTLRALGRGLSEKQVADEMGLSPHTVHEYVKALHQRFGVKSRGELLARLAGR
jgi:DNA-binding CsgD family transcriptional regulator